MCQPTAQLPIVAQFTSHLHTSHFKIDEITFHPVCLHEPDLPEKRNRVETIPCKECDKILGSDLLIQERKGSTVGDDWLAALWWAENETWRGRWGAGNALPPQRSWGAGVCGFAISSQWWKPSVLSNGPSNSLFTNPRPPQFTCWELTWNGYKWIVNKPLLYSVIYNVFIKENT